jgi:hypothetical protein
MRVISTKIHGLIDYIVGLLLLVAPYMFGFATGGPKQWLPMAIGAATIMMSLLTRYELSIAKVIPMGVHLAVDFAAGALLAASPWLFGFAHEVYLPHLIVGLMEIAVVVMTRTQPQTYAAAARS